MRFLKFILLPVNIFCLMMGCGKKAPTKEDVAEQLIPSAGKITVIDDSHLDTETHSMLPENPLHRSLIGTFWRFEDFDIRFLDSKRLFMSGGVIKKVSSNGIECSYTFLDNGVIEITILGIVKTGLWDGKKLVVDGMVGIQKHKD